MAALRQDILKALKDLAFAVGQNVHLTGTILTDALPAEMQAMPEEEWKRVWFESKRFAASYVKLVAELLADEEPDEGDEETA